MEEQMGFQTEGIIFMLIVWISVIILVVYCFTRVFNSERKNKAKDKKNLGSKSIG